MSMMEEALSYAKRGWYVFPCRERPGNPFNRAGSLVTPEEKTPYTSKGLNDATIDEDQIRAWWTSFPEALIGVNAGKSGLFVVDIDKKAVDGYETYRKWGINDSAALISTTPSGGSHLVFSGSGKSSTSAKTGIDTRGEGGYFIAPPSRVIDGKFKGEYKTLNDWSKTPGAIPDGLMGKLFPDKTIEYVKGSSAPSVGKKALKRDTLTYLVSGAPIGERNSTLFKVLADFAGCGYTKEEARDSALPASIKSGMSSGEFETVLQHAYSKPRTPAIPDDIQEMILIGNKDVVSSITTEQQNSIEAVVLACMIIDNPVIPLVSDILGYSDFQVLAHKIIFRAITRLYNRNVKVDTITVSEEIQKESVQISLSGITNLANQYIIDPEHVGSYAQILKEKSALRKVEALLDNKSEYLKKGSLFTIIANIEADLSTIAVDGGVKSHSVLNGLQATEMVIDRTKKIMSGEISQLETGFIPYDKYVGGIFSDELVLITGKSGDGKSALSLSIANHVGIIKDKNVLFFTLEMSTHETICRLVTQMTGIQYRNVYLGRMTENEWKLYEEAMNRISQSGIHFDDSFGLTPQEIRAKIRKMQDAHASKGSSLDLIVIDQLEMIRGYTSEPKYLQLDRIAYDTKEMTKEFGIPILLNHQIKVRGGEKGRDKNASPELGDLNQAGEKPANQVWAVTHKRDDNKKIIQSKISVIKNRNGSTMEFPVLFLGERMLFTNPANDSERAFTSSSDNNDDPHWVDDD